MGDYLPSGDTVIKIIGFAAAVSGLIRAIISPESRKITLTTVLVIVLALGTVEFGRTYQHQQVVTATAKVIIQKLGSKSKTFDQLFEEVVSRISQANPAILSEALDTLIREEKVGDTIKEMYDPTGEVFRFRVYYAKLVR